MFRHLRTGRAGPRRAGLPRRSTGPRSWSRARIVRPLVALGTLRSVGGRTICAPCKSPEADALRGQRSWRVPGWGVGQPPEGTDWARMRSCTKPISVAQTSRSPTRTPYSLSRTASPLMPKHPQAGLAKCPHVDAQAPDPAHQPIDIQVRSRPRRSLLPLPHCHALREPQATRATRAPRRTQGAPAWNRKM